MSTHRQIIGLFPNRYALARELGVAGGVVHAWHRRNAIPPRYWHRLATIAKSRGLNDVTVDRLAAIRAGLLEASAHDSVEYDIV